MNKVPTNFDLIFNQEKEKKRKEKKKKRKKSLMIVLNSICYTDFYTGTFYDNLFCNRFCVPN